MGRFYLLALCSTAGTAVLPAQHVAAQASGVEILLDQAQYWESLGRRDRATDAYRRVLEIDPSNAQARRGLRGPVQPAVVPPPAATVVSPLPTRSASSAVPLSPSPAPAPRRPSAAEVAGRDRAAGFQALEEGRLTDAARLFASGLARAPDDVDSLGGLGLVRLRQEQFAEARDLLLRASQRGSAERWSEALASAQFFAGLAEARSAFNAGNVAEAGQMAERLIASSYAETGPAVELLAAIYERQGRYQDAAAASAQLVRRPGADAATSRRAQVNTLRQQALAARQFGDDSGAEQLFQQGLMADQNDPWIRYEFARFLDDRGRVSEVESLIRSLIQLGGTEPFYAAALLLDRLGRAGEAQELMARVPQGELSGEMSSFLAGVQVDIAVERSRGLAAAGRMQQAVSGLRQIAATPNLSPGSLSDIGVILYEFGDTNGAGDLARQALERNPRDAEAYEPIIRLLAQTGQEAFALSALQRLDDAVGTSPEGGQMVARLNGVISAVQADQLRETGRFAESFELLQSAWNRAPGNAEILSALARLYQAGGLSNQAAQTFSLVLQQNPTDKGALIGLIDTASANGDRQVAQQALDRALSAMPGDHEIYLAGARFRSANGDERGARAYLQRAREIYMATSGLANGGFPASNPFANMQRAAPSGSGMINPFAFGSNPEASRDTAQLAQFAPYSSGNAQSGNAGFVANGVGGRGANMPYGELAPTTYPAQSGGILFDSSGPAMVQSRQSAGTGDPVLDQIQRDLQQLSAETGPRMEVRTNYRERSGEIGLSALQEIGATMEASTDFAGGRIAARAQAIVVDAGRPIGSGLARFGRNGTIEAQAIVDQLPSDLADADTQHASGVAISASYTSDLITIDAGVTPLGFEHTNLTGGVAVTPRVSPNATGRIWAERRAVTDSVTSHAGTTDPLTGEYWGGVMRTGGGIAFSWDRDGTGIYADGSYARYAGHNVRDNDGIQVNVGGYFRAFASADSNISIGVNANYQAFGNNQNYFTFGHGGYFSPQSFLSVSFPVRYAYEKGPLSIAGSLTPGYQSYEQRGEGLYPTDLAGQAVLDALKLTNSDVRARYDTISQTGFGLAADSSIYYQVSPRTRVGGELQYNSFGDYDEFKTLLGVRQQIGATK